MEATLLVWSWGAANMVRYEPKEPHEPLQKAAIAEAFTSIRLDRDGHLEEMLGSVELKLSYKCYN